MYSLQLKTCVVRYQRIQHMQNLQKRLNTPLHKEHLTDSVKMKLPLVDVFTYGYALKVS